MKDIIKEINDADRSAVIARFTYSKATNCLERTQQFVDLDIYGSHMDNCVTMYLFSKPSGTQIINTTVPVGKTIEQREEKLKQLANLSDAFEKAFAVFHEVCNAEQEEG